MAKLSGVKTLDMTNGEVTKVEYNGEVYTNVDGEAKVGDLVLVNDAGDLGDYDKGDYFETVDDGRFRANNNGWRNANDAVFSHRYSILRKQSAQSGGFKLVTDREPKAGDFVKFTRNYTDVGAGKYYEIYEDGDLVIEDDAGDKRWALLNNNRNAKFYEKVAKSETLTHNGATYTLVDRKAQPGDVVVFTENTSSYVRNDVPYEVTSYDDGMASTDRVIVYREKYKRTPANVKVYAPVALEKPVEPKLQVGDFAKVVVAGTIYNEEGIAEGEIVEIVEDDGSETPYRMKSLLSGELRWAKTSHIVRATDEEVAAAKVETERKTVEAKWAAIGRKPNEFKKGDIVRVTNNQWAEGVKVGDIVEVAEVLVTGSICDTVHGYKLKVELITPVEARFDH